MGLYEGSKVRNETKNSGPIREKTLPAEQGQNDVEIDDAPHLEEHHERMAGHHDAKAAHHDALASAHERMADHHRGEADYHRGKLASGGDPGGH